MRLRILALALTLATATFTAAVLAGGDDARAIIDKSIEAVGGEAKLARYNSVRTTEKGLFFGLGDDGLPYTANMVLQWPESFRMEIVGILTICLDGEKGWIDENGEIKDLPKERIANERYNHSAAWVASLLPLKDKAFTLKTLADGKDARVVLVTRKDYPDVKLYFDKANHLLTKFEFKGKEGGKELLMENTFSDYKAVDGAKLPHKVEIRRDGKKYVESLILTYTAEPKLDPKVFAKPK